MAAELNTDLFDGFHFVSSTLNAALVSLVTEQKKAVMVEDNIARFASW